MGFVQNIINEYDFVNFMGILLARQKSIFDVDCGMSAISQKKKQAVN